MNAINYTNVETTVAFLVEKTGSCFGFWSGKMSKAEQIKHFGAYFGKGLIQVDGRREMIEHVVKVCFGTDTDITKRCNFGGTIR